MTKLNYIVSTTARDAKTKFNSLGIDANNIISIVYNNQYILWYKEEIEEEIEEDSNIITNECGE